MLSATAAPPRRKARSITDALPVELFEHVCLALATLPDVAALLRTCRKLAVFVAKNHRVWEDLCRRVWKGRYLMPQFCQAVPSRVNLRASLAQAKLTTLSETELDAMLWTAHFQATTGLFWLNRTQGKTLFRRFKRGGTYWFPPKDDPLFSDPSVNMPTFTWTTYVGPDGVQYIELSGMRESRGCCAN